MKILIDIVHFPNVNFFKPSIKILEKQGHIIIITTQRRGRLPEIVKKEFPENEIFVFGKHTGSLNSMIFEANIIRFFKMLKIILSQKPDIGLSVTSFPLEIAMSLFGKPNFQFSDDPERKYDFIIHRLFATKVYFPPIIKPKGKYITFNALKEWAYLSPNYFTPNEDSLKAYNVINRNYIFIREVSTGSMNYLFQDPGLVLKFAQKLPKKYKILLSLEDKSMKEYYPNDWILLQEPIKDIHSLLYYSKYVISSGDSMAREGAMLGVQSIYCGNRIMKANKMLMDKGLLHKVEPDKVSDFISKSDNNEIESLDQNSIRLKLNEEWDDVTKLILSIIRKNKR